VQHIDRHQLNSMLGRHEDLTLVEVLNERPYREFHLPGAINVPFGDGFDEHIQKAVPDKTRPVVVYCSDTKCQASTKASRQMDALGYRNVYEYDAGKLDWKEAGLPIEGQV
jgi:rhodanese-related sulfurtransferase